VSRDFYQLLKLHGGISLEYTDLVETDFTAPAGDIYIPPERGDFRRLDTPRSIQLLQDAVGVIETFQTSSAEVRLPANTLSADTDDAGNGRLFFFKNSGIGTITIKDYLGVTKWLAKPFSIIIIVGNDNNNWDFYFTAKNIDFDNTTNNFVSTNTQNAIEESRSRAGHISNTSFTGIPRKVSIIFNTAFPNADYSVTIAGNDVRMWSFEDVTAAGFVLNSNAAKPLEHVVHWQAALNWEL
jgi:hypothetical protein